jgi:hypothetical protein
MVAVKVASGLCCLFFITVAGDLDVPGFNSRPNVVVANIGDINIGYLASPHQDIVGSDLCKPAKISTICGLMEAMILAIEEINNRNDLLPNITLGYVAIDDCHGALKALGVAVYFVTDDAETSVNSSSSTCSASKQNAYSRGPTNELRHYDVIGVVGPTTSASASLSASYLSLFHVPMIGIYSTSDKLSDKTIYGYFSRVVAPDSAQVRAMLDLCQHYGWSYVSFVYSEGSYGENAATKLDTYLRSKNSGYSICLALTVKINSDAQQSDIDAAIETLLQHPTARVVILFLADAHVAGFFHAARTIAGVGKFLWLGADFLTVFEDTTNVDTPEGGLFFDHPSTPVPGLEDYISNKVLATDNNVWNNEIFEAAYQCSLSDRYNITGRGCLLGATLDPHVCPIQVPETCRMYDSVHVFARAVHRLIANRCPWAFRDASQLNDCVQGPLVQQYVRNTTIDGLLGRISFDANGDLQENLVIKQFKKVNDRYETTLVGAWNYLERTISFGGYEAIDWTWFHGAVLNETADEAAIHANDSIASVCSLPCNDNEYIIHGNIPCCWSCRTCRDNEVVNVNRTGCESCPTLLWPDVNGTSCRPIEPTYLKLSHPISICLLVTAGLGMALTLAITVIYVAKRRHKLLLATYVPLSLVILVGSLVVSATVVVFVVAPDSVPVCVARNFGFNCGVNLIYAPLFVKNILIYRIFHAGPFMIAHTSARSQMVITIVIAILIQVGRQCSICVGIAIQ